MGKKPAVYTFQRPRKKKSSKTNSMSNMYTSTRNIDDQDKNGNGVKDDLENTAKYQRWTFYIMLVMIIFMVAALVYVQMRGIPVRIKG